MGKHVLRITGQYALVTEIGVKANSEESALQETSRMMSEGSLLDDNPSSPLLSHELVPLYQDKEPELHYVGPCEAWPTPDADVQQMHSEQMAIMACIKLKQAMLGNDGFLKQRDEELLDEAFVLAMRAISHIHDGFEDVA